MAGKTKGKITKQDAVVDYDVNIATEPEKSLPRREQVDSNRQLYNDFYNAYLTQFDNANRQQGGAEKE